MKIIKKNMLQRIQSIYLAVAFIAMILLSFRTPIYMLILTLASGLLALIGLFIYRNRTLQMKFIRVAVIINVVIGVRLFVVWKAFQVSLNTSCLLILFLSTFALILAYRGVKKDDDLVRSVDRIR
jgi:hypothetical protein